MKHQRVGIVGSGVAGLTAAVMLARTGHAVTVFEQSPTLGPVGAGVLLQPSGQLVLEKIGLLAKTIERAEPIERLFAVNHRGKKLIDLPYGELSPGTRAYGIHRGDLFTALYEAAVAAGVAFQLGTRVVRYGRRTAGVGPMDESGHALGSFDFLIGADGSRSVLRANCELAKHVYEYPHGALWVVAEHAGIRGELWQVTEGTKVLCGLLPMGGARCSLFWSLRKDEKEALFARGFEAWKSDVKGICPQSEPMLTQLKGWDDVRYTTYLHVRMPEPADDSCIFLGDAAHAMSPHLGQGINLALLDGYAFARACEGAANFEAACERYTKKRRAHTRVYSWLTRGMSPFFQSRGFIKGWGRDMFLPLMTKVPGLRGQMICTMAGLRAGWLGGRLQVD